MVRLAPWERADALAKAKRAGLSMSALAREAIAAFEPAERIAQAERPSDGAIRNDDSDVRVVYDDE